MNEELLVVLHFATTTSFSKYTSVNDAMLTAFLKKQSCVVIKTFFFFGNLCALKDVLIMLRMSLLHDLVCGCLFVCKQMK